MRDVIDSMIFALFGTAIIVPFVFNYLSYRAEKKIRSKKDRDNYPDQEIITFH